MTTRRISTGGQRFRVVSQRLHTDPRNRGTTGTTASPRSHVSGEGAGETQDTGVDGAGHRLPLADALVLHRVHEQDIGVADDRSTVPYAPVDPVRGPGDGGTVATAEELGDSPLNRRETAETRSRTRKKIGAGTAAPPLPGGGTTAVPARDVDRVRPGLTPSVLGGPGAAPEVLGRSVSAGAGSRSRPADIH